MKKTINTPETTPEEETVVEVANIEEPKEQKKVVNKVGSLLKEMRLQKGLRLSEVAKRLCIRKTYLEAIEESNYENIPPFPYGIGFIRSYADYLGLNSGNIVELYKEETNTNQDKDIFVLEPQSEATVPNRKYLLVSLLAIILIYAIWHLYNSRQYEEGPLTEAAVVEDNASESMPLVVEDFAVTPETTETETLIPTETETAVNTPAQVTITEASFTEPTPAVAEPEPEKGVVIKITKETWIEVKDAKKLYISKVLQPGSEYVVPEGGKGMILSVGKIDGAEVYVDGKLTQVAKPNKKTNIPLDPFIAAQH